MITPFVFKSAASDCDLPKTVLIQWVQSLAVLSLFGQALQRGNPAGQGLLSQLIALNGISDFISFPLQLQKGPDKTISSAWGSTTSGYMELDGIQRSTFMAMKLGLDFS